jgi:hypothetical protein
MGDLSRRVFIRHGMMGAAAVSVAAPMLPAIVGAAGEAPEAESTAVDLPALASSAEPLVARIRDAASGQIELFLGERQITYHDPDLVARLVRASGK